MMLGETEEGFRIEPRKKSGIRNVKGGQEKGGKTIGGACLGRHIVARWVWKNVQGVLKCGPKAAKKSVSLEWETNCPSNED